MSPAKRNKGLKKENKSLTDEKLNKKIFHLNLSR